MIAGTARAERVADGDGTAVDIGFGQIGSGIGAAQALATGDMLRHGRGERRISRG